jgi:hypothetical protein
MVTRNGRERTRGNGVMSSSGENHLMAGKSIGTNYNVKIDKDGRQIIVKGARRFRSASDAIAAKKSPKRRYARRII